MSKLPKTLQQFSFMLDDYEDSKYSGDGIWFYLKIRSDIAERICAGYTIHEDTVARIAQILRLVRKEYKNKGYAKKVNGIWEFCIENIPKEDMED